MTNANWPLMAAQVAFNAGFNPGFPQVWTDLTSRMWSFGCQRGRQYELDQNQAGTGNVVFADKDEILNPANAGAGYPYAGNVLPYRQIVLQAQWPPVPVGSAVNLLNASAQAPGPYDPSFESYTVGQLPDWLDATGGAAPVVGTTNPHTGSQCLTWPVSAVAFPQGAQWLVPCIPGKQYTCSAYVRQSSASTMRLQVVDAGQIVDAFNRTGSGGWGTATTGQAWTATTPADFTVASGLATITPSAANADRVITMPLGGQLNNLYVQVAALTALPVGGSAQFGLVSAYTDDNNYYRAWIDISTAGAVTVNLAKIVAGVFTPLGSASVDVNPLQDIMLHLRTDSPQVGINAWQLGQSEPSSFQVSVNPDTSLLTSKGGVFARRQGTSPTAYSFRRFQATVANALQDTTTVNAYVRLTATWTAVSPFHTVRVSTVGTAIAGTAFLDDVQHEPGASANAATTSGPVIYGVQRAYVERWPATWNYQGMYGYAQVTTVDAFAALAAWKLHAAYRAAVMALAPAYYWPFSEPDGAIAWADATSHPGNPNLLPFIPIDHDSIDPPKAGQTAGVAGDPGGVGVQFSRSDPSLEPPFLAVGPSLLPGTQPVQIPATTGQAWALTVAAWIVMSPFDPPGDQVGVFSTTANSTLTSNPRIQLNATDGQFGASLMEVVTPAGSVQAADGSSRNLYDGNPHLLVGVVAQDGTNDTALLYIDGVLAGSASLAFASYITQTNTVYVGNDGSGIITHLALWNRALAAGDVTTLYTAGLGYAGETSGERISRYLTQMNYPGGGNIDTGQSVMGADVATEGQATLDAGLAVTTTENGNLWVDSSGEITFTSRTRRYTTTTAKWTFGEAESPYLGDIAYDYDTQLVYNDVTVANAGGLTAEVTDGTSQSAYGPRTLQRNINVQDNNEATDAAYWVLLTHKDPHQRIATMTFDPGSNPALWPVALGIEIDDRATVKRRTTAGLTMIEDYFVEQISHTEAPGSWTVQVQASPASLWPTPWILEDAVYGAIDNTAVLGY